MVFHSVAVMEAFLRSGRNRGLRTDFFGTTIAHRLGEIAPAYATLFEGLRTGPVHLPIETVPLAQAADAHARLESQRTAGKLVLLPRAATRRGGSAASSTRTGA